MNEKDLAGRSGRSRGRERAWGWRGDASAKLKTARLDIGCTDDEKASYERESASKGLALSTWARRVLNENVKGKSK